MSTESLLRQLERAKTNTERWKVFFATTNVSIQDRALYLILRNSHDNLEKWRVFDNTFHKDLQMAALVAILPDATLEGNLKELWTVYECASSPELKTLARSHIYFLEHLPPESPRATTPTARSEKILVNEEILKREAKFAEILHDPKATPRSLYEVFFYTVSTLRKRQALRLALKQRPVTL